MREPMTALRRDVSLPFLSAVQLVALSADRLKQFSLVAMVGLLAPGSSFDLLKLTLYSQIPVFLLTPIAGVLIDRWNKPLTILGACLARALILLLVPAVYAQWQSLDAFFLAAGVLALFDLMFAPARSALLPEIVSPERLLGANAAFWTLGVVGTLLGFVGGGWLIDMYSWQASFHLDAVLYAAAAVFMLPLAFLRRPPRVSLVRASLSDTLSVLRGSLRDAFELMRQSRSLRASLLAQTLLFSVGGILSITAIARIQETAPDGSARFLSQIGAAFIGGLIVGAFVTLPYRDRRLPERTVSVGAMVAGVAIAGLGRTSGLIPMSIWAALLGLSISPVFVVTETLMQRDSPRQFTGRVFAAREGLIKAAYILAAIFATALDTVVGKGPVLVGMGLFLALLGVILERTHWLRTEKAEKS
ncbi:MAG TPA: MFS transporter [Candidatus Krumholzibacteria bacterium]|nr:MFS transporter [Candidatus Krumholzibacteria bacterium]